MVQWEGFDKWPPLGASTEMVRPHRRISHRNQRSSFDRWAIRISSAPFFLVHAAQVHSEKGTATRHSCSPISDRMTTPVRPAADTSEYRLLKSSSADAQSPERVSRLIGLGNAVRALTVNHAQTDRRTLGPLQTDKYRYRIFIYEIGR